MTHQREKVPCPWCGRAVRTNPDGLLYKHDNRNNSGFCKGSLMPVPGGSNAAGGAC